MSIIRSAGVAAVCAVAALAFSPSAALAGEITGNGKYIAGDKDAPLRANSICAYSGRNDGFIYADELEPGEVPTRTQSYGQSVRTGEPVPAFLQPGSSCNGRTGFLSGGGGEG